MSSSLIPSSYSEIDVKNVKITVNGTRLIEADESNVLILNTKILNDGISEINAFEIMTNLKLIDAKSRQYSTSNYLDLQEKGFSVSSEDCPFEYTSIAAGLSSKRNLCFEVPKSDDLRYAFVLYQNIFCTTSPDRCESVLIKIGDSTNQSQEPQTKIPEWVKNIFVWYGEGKISEDEVLNAIKFLISKGIINLEN